MLVHAFRHSCLVVVIHGSVHSSNLVPVVICDVLLKIPFVAFPLLFTPPPAPGFSLTIANRRTSYIYTLSKASVSSIVILYKSQRF